MLARKSSRGRGAAPAPRACRTPVREIGRVIEAEGIDAQFQRGGTITLARTPAQLARLRGDVSTAHARGFTEDDERMLDAGEAAADARGRAASWAVSFTPHCATVHPARLVRGLARAVEASGVHIFEQTTVRSIEPGRVETDAGTVRAEVVLRATEGYTPRLQGHRRAVAPVYSLMVATEPLDDATWRRSASVASPGSTGRRSPTPGT